MDQKITIPAETRDWSYVTESGCTECGYAPHRNEHTSSRLRATASQWQAVLGDPGAAQRPNAQTWSPIEYAAHVRDMCRLACERVELMLSESAPVFSNWDQDEQAVINDYLHADAGDIATDLARHLELAAQAFERVSTGNWNRRGYRSDGRAFTIGSFASFVLHEVEHHLMDTTKSLGLPMAKHGPQIALMRSSAAQSKSEPRTPGQ